MGHVISLYFFISFIGSILRASFPWPPPWASIVWAWLIIIIGSLQYLANGTRPDISFSVSKLTRYTSCPDKIHWGALDRVLRYMKGTVSLAIYYGRFPTVLEGYSGTSWIAKNSESNGCSGYVFTLGGGAVSWKSAKQTLIIQSTFEVELCALDTIGNEAEWLYGLLSKLSIVSQPLPPIVVRCDSQTTIAKWFKPEGTIAEIKS
ncbi:hypothetical protein Sango_2081600 [Sesamum angolense]|uniref:Uncharacterized protein n=1 Tax=Sesamum angolense TaxID=2727404 RepID=A0AAE2BLV5_9LAMI|nr:hypothetical protein Sango_2081600 [Sesamum angolense]